MDWNEIIDRKGTYKFISLGKALSGSYLPEDIQSLIDTYGVRETVRLINEQHQNKFHKNAISIVNHSGDLKVIQA
jgi:hypothetical protein